MKSPLPLHILSATCLCVAPAAVAATPAAVALDDVTVTATRSLLSLADAPAAVSVIDASRIADKNVSRLGDALDQVPGLYLQNGAFGWSQGTSGTSGLSLRGIDQSRTLILLDGQPLQDASSGKVNWRIPFVDDIERIEVVPGAFSSLYGSNAIGGVINVISKQPDRTERSVRLKKGWNDASGEEASVYWRDTLTGGLGVVAGFTHQDHDSFVNDFVVKTPVSGSGSIPVTGWQPITTRDGTPAYLVGDKGRTPWTSANAVLKLSYPIAGTDRVYGGVSWAATEESFTAFDTYLRDASGLPVSSGSLAIDGKKVSLAEFDFVNNSPLRESATRVFAGYEAKLGGDALVKLDLARIDRGYRFTAPGPTAVWNGGRGSLTDTPNTGLDGNLQLSFASSANQAWVIGAALHREDAKQKLYTLANWRDDKTQTALNSGFDGSSTTLSLYAQDEIAIADAVKVYLGGRWDRWQTHGSYFNLAPTPPSASYPRRDDAAFSPKAALVYRPDPGITLRASLGRAFRAPANLDLYATTVTRGRTVHNNPDLAPETATTAELGAEWRMAGTSRAAITLFHTRLADLIYLKQVDTATTKESFRINAGRARVAGVELSAHTRLASWLTLDANYAYVASEVLKNAADPLSVGKRLTDSPRHIAGIELVAHHGPWSGTLGVRHVSHVFLTAQNTDVVEGVPGSYDAHTRVDARAGYAFSKRIKVALAVDNLLDETAYSFFRMPGRSVTAEVDLAF